MVAQEKPQQSSSESESEAEHCRAEKPRHLSAEELIELAIVKCNRISQNLENLERQSSDYGDRVLGQRGRDYQLFPQTSGLSLSFTSILQYQCPPSNN